MLCLIWVQIVCKGYQLAMKDPGSEVTVAFGFDVVSIDVGIHNAIGIVVSNILLNQLMDSSHTYSR